MAGDERGGAGAGPGEGSVDLERLLEERERLEALIKQKYTRIVTVMFTDIKGSTAMAENEGDVATRLLIKKHNDILIPLINENRGVLVKTMGDGTLSYFEQAQDAVRAAVRIQQSIERFNQGRESRTALRVRIGLNTGTGIVEQNDIYGDAVNVASRFESLANPGEVYLSESTYNALENREEFYCRYIKTSPLKEKKGLHKVFKAFWDEEEIARDRAELASGGGAGAERAGETISLEQLRTRQSAFEPEETEQAQELLRRIRQLERERELLELHLLLGEHRFRSTQELSLRLQEELDATERMELSFSGKPALWFYRDAITIGRFPEADFPLTNKAMSRVPIRIGIRNGEGWLKIEGRGMKDVKPVEVERSGARTPVAVDAEHPLGASGLVIFSVCFPLEYQVVKRRFLVLRLLDPTECLRKNFTFTLQEIWRDFPQESARQLIIGT
jgi:class 3 adenylate cyclase